MKTNVPIRMMCKESGWSAAKEVLVYDFMHDIVDTFQSFALCWVPSSQGWITVNVACLEPILSNKILKENV